MEKNIKIKFNGSPKPTLGVELELFTLDKETLSLTNGAPLILDHFKDNFFFKEELLQCIVEITTDVCDDVNQIYDDLRAKLDMAIEFSNKFSSAVDKLEVEKKNQKPIPTHANTAPVMV